MKALFTSLVLLAFYFTPVTARAQDDQGVSFQVFYDQLGDQGTWIQTDDYGYVFQPNVTDPNWAPYTDGHWVSTDEGWAWASDEPWGWATYHYGRWANIDGTGWVWVPGYRWAPAWVSWRYGDDYCGWAPLPPEALDGSNFGDDVDVSFHIGAGYYNFVHVEDMGNSNYRGRYANRGNNFTIIRGTKNITNINNSNGRATDNFHGVSAGGPPLNEINAHSRQHVQTVQLTQASQPGRSTLQGNSLSVFAPQVNSTTAHQGKPARVGQTINHPTFDRGDSAAKPLGVTAEVKAPSATPQAIQPNQQKEENAPAHVNKNEPTKPAATTSPYGDNPKPTPTFHPQAQANGEVTKPVNKPEAQPKQETGQPQHDQQQEQKQPKQETPQQESQQKAQPQKQDKQEAPKPQDEQKAQPQKQDKKDAPQSNDQNNESGH